MRTNQYLVGMAVCMALAFIGCNSKGKSDKGETPTQDTLLGLVGDGTSMHVLQLVLGNDSTDFFIGDSCDVSNANLIIGNLVQVIYRKDSIENIALKIIGSSTYENALGNWTCPIPGQKGVEGIRIELNGQASSINMHTLVYKRWGLTDCENQLLLEGESIGNGVTFQFRDTAIIREIDQKWMMEILGKGIVYTKE